MKNDFRYPYAKTDKGDLIGIDEKSSTLNL